MAVGVIAYHLELDARPSRDEVDRPFLGRSLVPFAMYGRQRIGDLGLALEDVLDFVVEEVPFDLVAGAKIFDPGGCRRARR